MEQDEFFMSIAYKEACKAFEEGEVPVGACLVKDNQLLARSHNQKESLHSPLAHAEISVIQKAIQKEQDWRLSGTVLYVTLEPCLMCTSSILESRISKVVCGCLDPKVGVLKNHLSYLQSLVLNYHQKLEVIYGVKQEECSLLLKDFFKKQRAER